LKNRPHLLKGEDLPTEPRQARSLEKRERLKAAALALFSEKGYERSSVEEVADRAGLAVGSFYQHFRSKRQLLLVLMDDLLEGLSKINLQPGTATDVRAGIRGLLSHAFSQDLRYLGAYRAWREALLSDPELAAWQGKIQNWTTSRLAALFSFLDQLPGARDGVDVNGLASAMDSFFWDLLSQATQMSKARLQQRIEVSTHLIYHAFFKDPAR
jgi:AcrR family transcriptional regulator